MVTVCKFRTCACIVKWNEPLTDYDRQAEFIQQCRTHNTPRESLIHNGLSRLNPGTDDPLLAEKQRAERDKTEFQRR